MTGEHPLWVIGVGASAGGLNALRDFVHALSDDLAAAVVVLQHRDPDRESQLASLLAKGVKTKISDVADGDRLTPGTVHILPPGKDIIVTEEARLKLSEPHDNTHRHHPIDQLFFQLSSVCGPRTIGVVLSGTGNDATQGARDIKRVGGTVLVQAPQDAEFDGMPRAAIETSLVDFIDQASALAAAAENLIRTSVEVPQASDDFAEKNIDGFEETLRLLNDENGFDFSEYKPGTIGRRIRRRMGIAQQDDIGDYLEYLKANAQEREILAKDILVGVTRFFRDGAVWEALGKQAIEQTLSQMSDGDTFRAWAAGCSTGEEAYTLAITVLERIKRSGKDIKPVIFASDLNHEAIEFARTGRYPASSLDEMPRELVERWFERLGQDVRVRPRLRDKLVFAVQNAVSDPPFSGLDLITCRNLMIYLGTSAQKRLFETFHFSLKPGAHLMLGQSEGAERADPWFERIDKGHRIFRRTDAQRRSPVAPAGRWSVNVGMRAGRGSTHQEVAGSDPVVKAMLSRFAPPTVQIDQNMNVLRFHGDVGAVLDFSAGSMSGSLVKLLAKPFQSRVWSAINTAKTTDEVQQTVVHHTSEEEGQTRVIVEPISDRTGRDFLVYFVEAPEFSRPSGSPAPTELPDPNYHEEMEALRIELNTVMEKGEASNEELQAANEEVLSANEELQSSNEELETSREELQSLNEELTTINTELEEKVRELEAVNDDLANLISSTDIATIFLDTDLTIRRYSDKATEVVSIRSSDFGRPISELSLKIDDDELVEDARSVLAHLRPVEREIVGEDFAYLRRIVPYRTLSDRIQGVVITLSDIRRVHLASKRLVTQSLRQASLADLSELALRPGALEDLQKRIVSDIAEHLDASLVEIQMLTPDKSAFKLTAGHGWPRGVTGHATCDNDSGNHLGFTLRSQDVLTVDDGTAEKRFSLTEILADQQAHCGVCMTIGGPQSAIGVLGAWRNHDCNFSEEERNFLRAVSKILWLATHHAESRRAQDLEANSLQSLIDGLPVMVALIDHDYRILMSNRAFEQMGLVLDDVRDATLSDVFGEATLQSLKEAVADGKGREVHFETALHIPGEHERTFLIHCAPRRKGAQFDGYYIAAIDIDERKRWEERNKVISAELDHRVKNILALVNTIARMTGRNSADLDEFQSTFAARIKSLSRTHALLANKNWDGLSLHQLLRDELEAYSFGDFDQFSIDGPELEIGASASQSLALVVHELATNAAKYGALSVPEGRLKVSWEVGENLDLVWEEGGLTSISEPSRSGFGSSVIKSAIETQLEGSVDVRFLETGAIYKISIRVQNLIARDSDD